MMSGITMLLEVWIQRVMSQAGSFEPTLAEHRLLLDAVIIGDPEAAKTAAAAHMDRARRRLERSLESTDTATPEANTPTG
jgi:DNA-binding GntR family transcriptional regulator